MNALVVGLAFGAAVAAHQGSLTPLAPFVADGELIGGSSTWGVMLKEGALFLRVCDEATGGGTIARARTDSGAVLIGGVNGLIRSVDGGCSFTVPTGLVAGSEVTVVLTRPGRAWAATGRFGFPNGVFRSDDDGVTFQATALSGSASPIFDLFIADDGTLFASGNDIDTGRPLLFASGDDGATWAEGSVDLSPLASARFGGTAGGDALLLAVALDDSGVVWRIPPTLDTAEEIAATTLPPTHAAMIGDVLVVVEFPGSLYTDGVSLDIEAGCVTAIDGVFWACGATTGPLGDAQFASSTDGVNRTPLVPNDTIFERDCPAGTVADLACFYPGVDAGIAVVDAGVDVDPIDGGTLVAADGGDGGAPIAPGSCATGGASLCAALLALTIRRRHRRPKGGAAACPPPDVQRGASPRSAF